MTENPARQNSLGDLDRPAQVAAACASDTGFGAAGFFGLSCRFDQEM
jgi:hypothetical protein